MFYSIFVVLTYLPAKLMIIMMVPIVRKQIRDISDNLFGFKSGFSTEIALVFNDTKNSTHVLPVASISRMLLIWSVMSSMKKTS